jgi:hypothetical protein
MSTKQRDRLGSQMGWIPPTMGETSDAGPWVGLGGGRYQSKSTGRLKYVPNEDPAWHADLRRVANGGTR